EARFPGKTTSFQRWAERLAEHARTPASGEELAFWTQQPWAEVRPLPRDLAGEDRSVAASETLDWTLGAQETESLLQRVPQAYHTQINDVLLTALAQAMADWTGARTLFVDLEGHGREELFEGVDLSRTVGWFTTIFPVVLRLDEGGPGEALKGIKEQLRRIPDRGIGYGLLRYLREDEPRERLAALPAAEVSVNYLGQLDATLAEAPLFRPASESSGPSQDPRSARPHLLDVSGIIVGGRLRLSVTFGTAAHRRATVESLLARLGERLRALIAHCLEPAAGGYTPSDFSLAKLDQASLDRLLGDGRGAEDLYGLTPMQQGMLFHALRDPRSGVYVEQLTCAIDHSLDVEVFEQAWRRVVEHHAVLRSTFHWEGVAEPVQVVRRRVELPFVIEDWQALPAAAQRARLAAYLEADRERGFALDRAPLMRLWLARTAASTHQLVWTHHHLLIDGWSLPLLFKDVLTTYEALRRGEAPNLAPVRPYRDYLAWLDRQDPTKAEAFWRHTLRGFTEPTSPGIEQSTGQRGGRDLEVHLSESVTATLGAVARHHHLTLNTLVQGAWALLLSRYSGSRDVVFGATVSGRPVDLEGSEAMVGLFINTLPVRAELPEGGALAPWLSTLQDQQVEARQHQHTPLTSVQGWSEIPRGQALFDTL
ncbi:MAG: condensation domain-containing protein, partial [Byssovorax sp.]